jgi:hypothetical protein
MPQKDPEGVSCTVDPLGSKHHCSLLLLGKEDHAEMEGSWRDVLAVLVILAQLTGRYSR